MPTMTNHSNSDNRDLPALITRQIRDRSNQRFLRNMPVFKTSNDAPDVFDELLARLERAEKDRQN